MREVWYKRRRQVVITSLLLQQEVLIHHEERKKTKREFGEEPTSTHTEDLQAAGDDAGVTFAYHHKL